ncbi:MAG: 2-amino-4-hydroxy-6-hydroxymethyldihydropteridine diphosphokinase [Lentisphaerae bacterium]|nr:2-amino-4-hydroxy-6-hydroxymethyldihydropteridine diphosphokinase [Lentisphaerota bacterium]
MEVALSLGSNLGDRLVNLMRARAEIGRIDGVTVTGQARVWETDPVDAAPAHRDALFLNTVLLVETPLPPPDLAAALRAVEERAGRVRKADRNAPRTIDVDIVYAGGLRLATAELSIPHPRWSERRFVVQPLADVRPDLVLPGADRTVREILEGLPDTPRAALFRQEW